MLDTIYFETKKIDNPCELKLLAFDIEVADDVPEDWKQGDPLAISTIATFCSDEESPIVWYARDDQGNYLNFSKDDVSDIWAYLNNAYFDGYKIIGWNSTSFDFPVIINMLDESQTARSVNRLIMRHYDIMFQFLCDYGFPVGLNAVANGMNIEGKPEGMSGKLAPEMWRTGDPFEQKQVLEYVSQDVKILMDVALAIARQKHIEWISKKGYKINKRFPELLTVEQSLELSQPDTSWMKGEPLMTRESATDWMSCL